MTQPTQRVLFFIDTNQIAGAEQSLRTLITHLPQHVEVTVAGSEPAILDELVRDRPGAVVEVVPPLAGKRDLRNVASLWRKMGKFEACVIHLNKTEVANLRYVELLLRLRRLGPIVSVVHHVERPRTVMGRALTRSLARGAAFVVAVDHRVAIELQQLLGIPAGSVKVVPNTLPVARPVSTMSRIESSTGPFVVGVLSRLIPHKRVADVVRSVAELPDVQLVIGGDGPQRQWLEQLVVGFEMTDRVTFLGWVDPDDVFGCCDIVVSVAEIEGHPMALLDARRRGIPIVAADVGGVAAIVEHEVTGLLVPPRDVAGLVRTIERLRTSPELCRSMRQAALLAASEAPGPSDMVADYCRLYWPAKAS